MQSYFDIRITRPRFKFTQWRRKEQEKQAACSFPITAFWSCACAPAHELHCKLNGYITYLLTYISLAWACLSLQKNRKKKTLKDLNIWVIHQLASPTINKSSLLPGKTKFDAFRWVAEKSKLPQISLPNITHSWQEATETSKTHSSIQSHNCPTNADLYIYIAPRSMNRSCERISTTQIEGGPAQKNLGVPTDHSWTLDRVCPGGQGGQWHPRLYQQ